MSVFFAKSLLFALSLFPLFIFSPFLSFVLFYFLRQGKDFRYFEINLESVLNYKQSSKESKEFFKKNLEHFLLSFIEMLKLAFCKKKIRFKNSKKMTRLIEEAEAQGQGSYILVTAHLGSWDLLGYACSLCSKSSFYALAKPSRSRFVTNLLKVLREKLGIRVLWTGKNNFQRSLLKTLKEGGSVGFLIDQKPLNREGVLVEFLGKKTPFIKGPATLAKKFQKPVVLAYCLRENKFHYTLQAELISVDQVREKSVEELSEIFAQSISKSIYKKAHQWVWSYKRWPRERKDLL